MTRSIPSKSSVLFHLVVSLCSYGFGVGTFRFLPFLSIIVFVEAASSFFSSLAVFFALLGTKGEGSLSANSLHGRVFRIRVIALVLAQPDRGYLGMARSSGVFCPNPRQAKRHPRKHR